MPTEREIAETNKKKHDDELDKQRRITNMTVMNAGRGNGNLPYWRFLYDDKGGDPVQAQVRMQAVPTDPLLKNGYYRFENANDNFDIRVKDGKIYAVPGIDYANNERPYDDWDKLRKNYERTFDFIRDARGGTAVKFTMTLPENFTFKKGFYQGQGPKNVMKEIMMVMEIAEKKGMAVDLSGFDNVLDKMSLKQRDKIMKIHDKLKVNEDRVKTMTDVRNKAPMEDEIEKLKNKDKLEKLVPPPPAGQQLTDAQKRAAIDQNFPAQVFKNIDPNNHEKKLEAIEKQMEANEKRLAELKSAKDQLVSTLNAHDKLVDHPDKYRNAHTIKEIKTWGARPPEFQESTQEFIQKVQGHSNASDATRTQLLQEMQKEVDDLSDRQTRLHALANTIGNQVNTQPPGTPGRAEALSAKARVDDKHTALAPKINAERAAAPQGAQQPTVHDLGQRNGALQNKIATALQTAGITHDQERRTLKSGK